MTTLTPGGQRLRTVLVENAILVEHEGEIETGMMVGAADLNAAATALALDAPPAGGDGGLRKAVSKVLARQIDPMAFSIGEGEKWDERRARARKSADALLAPILAVLPATALARPDPREQAAAGVGALAEAINKARYAPDAQGRTGLPYRTLEESSPADVEYCTRLACAALAALTQPHQTPEAAAPSGSVGDGALREALELVRMSRGWQYLAEETRAVINTALAQQPAPQAPVADAAGVRDRWLDWRGGVEGKEASVVVATKAVKQARESGREYTDEEIARHVCWMIGLDHVWQHVEALRNALAARQAPEVATALRKEADRLLDRAAALAALTPPQAARPGDGEGLTLRALHTANIARQAEWCPDQVPDLSFRGNELAGETGEACNVIKKLERERQGWRGSRAILNDLAEELADVVICADLCAVTAGIDLDAAVVAKFNATSDKVGISVRLPAPVQADAAEGRS